jgi:UDP-N-acetylglucosamine transferase subunit ALG13
MNQPETDKKQGNSHLPGRQLRILVAPLDWGLGHATRCIPIIRELLAQGCSVWLAGEGNQEQLLKTEFPNLPFLPLKGYRIKYAKTKRGLIWQLIRQWPKMKKTIRSEHNWLQSMVAAHHFDGVISDNRYGLYHTGIPSIFITHQLHIKSPFGKWTEKIVQKRNYRFINKFTACWVPDNETTNSLAGELSHPSLLPAVPIHYIGLLSRFNKKKIAATISAERKNHLLILLSGPEPQRSILEGRIINEIVHYIGTTTLVRGLPGEGSLLPSTNMIKLYNHLPTDELAIAIAEAEIVISRSGYSSVMDLLVMQKRTILIPTPGQTEQEYLGAYLQENQLGLCVTQNNFNLTESLKLANEFAYKIQEPEDSNVLGKVISSFLQQLN